MHNYVYCISLSHCWRLYNWFTAVHLNFGVLIVVHHWQSKHICLCLYLVCTICSLTDIFMIFFVFTVLSFVYWRLFLICFRHFWTPYIFINKRGRQPGPPGSTYEFNLLVWEFQDSRFFYNKWWLDPIGCKLINLFEVPEHRMLNNSNSNKCNVITRSCLHL